MNSDPSGKNHGEGDPEAAKHFNDAEKSFVSSSKGKSAIEAGPKVSAAEEAKLKEAERQAAARAKGQTPPDERSSR
jgi:hypothetical protein